MQGCMLVVSCQWQYDGHIWPPGQVAAVFWVYVMADVSRISANMYRKYFELMLANGHMYYVCRIYNKPYLIYPFPRIINYALIRGN